MELDEDLHTADQLIRNLGLRRHDADRQDVRDSQSRPQRRSAKRGAEVADRRSGPRGKSAGSAASSLLSWSLLSVGLMAFVFGAVLLAWSFLGERPDLGNVGMPFTLAGQAALVIGLVFQLDSVSRSHRAANETLLNLDERVSELRHATTLLTSDGSQSARSFYLHLAEGASPHLLLADVKGQLDLLAQRLSDEP